MIAANEILKEIGITLNYKSMAEIQKLFDYERQDESSIISDRVHFHINKF